MVVYELDNRHLCHVYTARHRPESASVKIIPIKGGFRDPLYRYESKWIPVSLLERIDPPPAMPAPEQTAPKRQAQPMESRYTQIKLI